MRTLGEPGVQRWASVELLQSSVIARQHRSVIQKFECKPFRSIFCRHWNYTAAGNHSATKQQQRGAGGI